MKSIPLSEIYRPTQLDEVINIDKERFYNLIKTPQEMPNLLLYGPQGTGKTTTAKIILKELSPINFIRINGSDTTGVDTIRDKVYNFMTSMSSEEDKPKIIWIEEFDFMSQASFAALRSMIEQYIRNARFIVTLNYINKIPEPIQSRFTCIEFKKCIDNTSLIDRLKYICYEEGIKYNKESTVFEDIIKKSKGDIRACINTLQELSSNKEKNLPESLLFMIQNTTEETYKLLLDKQWSKIRYEIPKLNPDYGKLLVELDEMFFKSSISTPIKAEINEIIARSLYEMSFVFDESISFSACCSKIIKVL